MRTERIIFGQREFPGPFKKLEECHTLWNRIFTTQLHPQIVAFEKAMRGVTLCHFGIGGSYHIGEYAGLLWERIGEGISLEGIRLCVIIEAMTDKGPNRWELVSNKVGIECKFRFTHVDSESGTSLNSLNSLLEAVEKKYDTYRQLQREMLTALEDCNQSSASVTGIWHTIEHQVCWSKHCHKIEAVLPGRGEKIKLQRLPNIILVTEDGNVPFKNVSRITCLDS